jgi:hypothetical protein
VHRLAGDAEDAGDPFPAAVQLGLVVGSTSTQASNFLDG